MTTTATRLTRLELWSGLQCAGGRRLAIWPLVVAAAMVLTPGLDSQLTVQAPLDAEASVSLARWNVVRVWESDVRWDEWVVTDVTRDDTSATLTFTAGPPTLLLGRGGFVEERTPDGTVRFELDRVGLTPTQVLDTLVIAPLAAQGLGWVQRGLVTPVAVVDLSLAWQTPLQALTLLAEAIPCELAVRRIGIGAYALDLVERVGFDAPVLDLRRQRNLLEFSQNEALSEHATVITGKGATIDGEGATIANAVWRVAAVSGVTVTLADVQDGPGPIAYDEQLNGLQLELPSGATIVIVSSTFATQQLVCASAPTLVVGAVVRIRDGQGDDLTALRCPPAVTDYGPVAGLLERADLPGHRNLVPNSVLRAWAGAGSTPPDDWSVIGSPTLSRLTTGPQITRGNAALQVVSSASGTGVATPPATLVPSADRPFLSGYLTLWVMAGTVRVELVATTAMGEKVYPIGGNLATNREMSVQIDLGLTGIEAFAVGMTAAQLRVVQHSTSGATWIVESAQLTTSAAQLPFVEGSGGNRLWHAVNASLQTAAVPRLRTSLTLIDLARLFPETFGDDCSITLGGTARVVLPVRGIDGTARIVRVQRNLLKAGEGAITLSDRPEDLTGSLARAAWKPRPIPPPPIIVIGGEVVVSTAFDVTGALSILVRGPEGVDSLRAAVSTVSPPSAAAVDAATGTLRDDGDDVATLTSPGPFTAGQLVYISVRAYRSGVGTRLVQLVDAADAADAAQGPSLEVRTERFATFVRVRYAFIGALTYRVNDVLTAPVPASPFDLPIPGPGVPATTYALICTRNGSIQSEPIPVFAEDLIYPDVVLNPVSAGTTDDRVAFDVFSFDPRDGSAEPSRQIVLTDCTAVGFSGVGPHTIGQGATIAILKPLARKDGSIELRSTHPGGGTSRVYRTIPARDLTGIGVEVLSNPEFRTTLPRRAVVYDSGSTGLVVVSDGTVIAQNTSGALLLIVKGAGAGTAPGSGGFTLNLARNTGAEFVADAYREGALYLITLRASIPVGFALNYTSNAFGTGGVGEWLSSQAGIGAYTDYVLRLQIGVGGAFSTIGFFYLTGNDLAAVQWGVAKINWRDLNASERQPVASVTARVVAGGDADTAIVQVDITPLTNASRVQLAASTEAPEAGSPALNVEVVSGSTWAMPRRAFRTGIGSAFFLGRTPGFELATCAVEIPEQGRDTVPLSLTAERVGGSATTEVVRFFPVDPFPQGAGSLTLTLLPSTASVSPTGPLALTSGSPTDVTITKPVQTSEPAIVGATLSNGNRVSAYLPIKIEPVRPLIPGRIERLPSVQSGNDHIERFRAYLSTGVEVDYLNVGANITRTIPGGSASSFGATIARDTVNGWFTFTLTRVPGDDYSGVLVLGVDTNTARTEMAISIPSVPLTPPANTTPRIASINVVNTGTSSVAGNLNVVFGGDNLPVGGSYRLSVENSTFISANVFTGTGTSFTILAGGAYTDAAAPPSGKAPDRARGLLEMLDASNVTVADASVPYNVFYGVI